MRCDALAVLTLLGAMLSLAGGAAAVPPAGNLEPKITDENGAPTIALPEALLKQIQTKYPGFRVPRKEDVTGEWANTRTTDQVPYAVWGDMDGNGLTDVALMVLGQDKWKVVVFLQQPGGGYHDVPILSRDIRRPDQDAAQLWTLSLVKKGEIIRQEQYDGEKMVLVKSHTLKTDAIDLDLSIGGGSTYYWSNQRFERIRRPSE